MTLEVLIAVESKSTVGEGQIKHWQIFFSPSYVFLLMSIKQK